jgi:hypothetical protein
MITNINKNEKRIMDNGELTDAVIGLSSRIDSLEIRMDKLEAKIDTLIESINDGFNRIFETIDQTVQNLDRKNHSRLGNFKREVRHRCMVIDHRIVFVENNSIYRNEFNPLVKRVETLEVR